jgi:putative aldouronate transport system permease protein
MRLRSLKKVIQTASYAPYFISVVVLVGMMNVFFSPSSGIVNVVIKMLGGTPVYFMGKPELFRPIYVWTTCGRPPAVRHHLYRGFDRSQHGPP